MKDRLGKLEKDISRLMQEKLAAGQFDKIESLAPLLTQAGNLKVQIDEIEMGVTTLEVALARIQNKKLSGKSEPTSYNRETQPGKRGSRAAPSTLRIRINWRLNNCKKDDEEIFSPIAANSLAIFMGRMIAEFGNDAIQQLLKLKVNRGPLISRSPQNDFDRYQSKRVPGTDLFVLTNNTTAEKADIIKQTCRELRLVPGSVIVETEGRFDR